MQIESPFFQEGQIKIRTKEWQETYMSVLTTYLVKLIENADSVPEYLKETLPTMYKPQNLLIQLDDQELDKSSEEKQIDNSQEEPKEKLDKEAKKEEPKVKEEDSDSFEVLSREETNDEAVSQPVLSWAYSELI